MRGAQLQYVNFTASQLTNADLGLANMQHADLSCANLRSAILDGADLRHAHLLMTNLAKAQLKDANLEGVNLTLACLDYAVLPSGEQRDEDADGRMSSIVQEMQDQFIKQSQKFRPPRERMRKK